MNTLASAGQLRASFLRWVLFTVPAILLLGFLSGMVGGPDTRWFQSLVKPEIFPNPAWFGIVWTVLYIMMGVALALICAAWGARGRAAALILFFLQFVLNLAWTPIFFLAQDMQLALIVIGVLDVLVIATIAAFWRIRMLAGALLLPYLAWILFGTVLNYQFLVQNPDAGAVEGSNAVERFEL